MEQQSLSEIQPIADPVGELRTLVRDAYAAGYKSGRGEAEREIEALRQMINEIQRIVAD